MSIAWLTRYPMPDKIIINRGKELVAEFKSIVINDYKFYVTP